MVSKVIERTPKVMENITYNRCDIKWNIVSKVGVESALLGLLINLRTDLIWNSCMELGDCHIEFLNEHGCPFGFRSQAIEHMDRT
jgi:hypothetical protein